MIKSRVKKKLKDILDEIRLEYKASYDQASLDSDGELGVHNDYEQGKEDALKEIEHRLNVAIDCS